ncbi:unnamed protein product, partial [Enterobius vermicularis]|uniref:Secreted protein n=1 Tax=Enterobius vermicularis TaxID=51028 RepID=A0A0N4VNP0_ENTVE
MLLLLPAIMLLLSTIMLLLWLTVLLLQRLVASRLLHTTAPFDLLYCTALRGLYF